MEAILQAEKNGIHNGNPGLTTSISSPPAWNGFRSVKVAEVHPETSEVTSIVLADSKVHPSRPRFPGNISCCAGISDKNSRLCVRSYSISGASDSGTYRISVKRGAGPGSQHLVDATQVGDQLRDQRPSRRIYPAIG